MVDINLFKEEDEEEWKTPPDEGGGGGEDVEGVLGEDLDLGGEETDAESPSFEDEKFLGDEDAIPDFEEPEERELEEDYEYGDNRARGAPVWLWAFLGIVVAAAAFYLFYLQPRQKAKSQIQTITLKKSPPDSLLRTQRPVDQTVAIVGDSSTTIRDQSLGEADVSRETTSTNAPSSTVRVVSAAMAVFESLSSQGQLGTIVFEGGKFHVGYVSSTAGVAESMGQQVQKLMGASSVRVSPEDRHSTAGKIQYWGVVSGDLPASESVAPTASTTRFNTADSFVAGIRELGTQNRMTFQQTVKFSVQSDGGRRKAPVRMKIEGARANAINFLNALKGFQGNYDLNKLTIAPVNISDYTASQAKLVLDFAVWIG